MKTHINFVKYKVFLDFNDGRFATDFDGILTVWEGDQLSFNCCVGQ